MRANEKSGRTPFLDPDAVPSLRVIPFGSPRTDPLQLLSRQQQLQLAGIATRLRLPPRMVLYREDEEAHCVFIIGDGVVKTFRDLPSGRRRVMAFLFAQDVFGLAESGRYVNTAQAVTSVTLYRLQVDTLSAALKRDAELQFHFLCKVTHALRQSLRQTVLVGRRDAVGRVAMFLRMLQEQDSGEDSIAIPMTRSDIANYLGLSLEAVSRACRSLETRNIVHFSSLHDARVIDRPRFDALAAHH